MRYTEDLMSEHRGIEKMLAVLTGMGDRFDAGERVEPSDVQDALAFLIGFGDACHHYKEERALFPAMLDTGEPRVDALVESLLAEHDRGRALVARMREASGALGSDDNAGERFAESARAYSGLLTEHIRVEDEDAFPLADSILGTETTAYLAEEFDRIEREVIGEGKHEEYHRLLDRLSGEYVR